ncbi:ATP-dependent helicase [Nocardioides sp. ChNu-153]|uniref:ATP-dependent helicase n=1 Tax=unclassified Nocardioides TaxID=2615069 RepID=UPI00240556F4|nr:MULTISPECIES: ATP-dependent DNA helicase [unclassified Nocardioides]MDF9716606.1 ATP-dependent helicase [Nocardioides sp. ChNu-99]MDN7120539.1 ATP-dependent helicase [Nocardioides sp. ChNu-153]
MAVAGSVAGSVAGPAYQLVRPQDDVVVPRLDAHQQRVVDHPGGPLLVLAGPGTGKTTTLVEAIVDRVENRGADPSSVLALTFSRKAAEQLRDRVTARLGRTTEAALCSTVHSFAYGLVRRYSPPELYAAPLRLLSAPEQDVVLAELLTDAPESVRWPDALRRAVGTRGFAREVHHVLARAREKGLSADELVELGERSAAPELVAAGAFLGQYLTILDHTGAIDYADLVRRAVIEAEDHRDELRERYSCLFVDEYQDTDPGQVELLRALAGDGRDLVAVGDPHQSIYGFRGADVRGILEFPRAFPQADGSPAPVAVLATTRRFGPRVLRTATAVASRLSLAGSIDPVAREVFSAPVTAPGAPRDRVEVLTFDTERAEAEHLADLLRRAHLEDGVAWGDMAVLARSGRATLPALRRSLSAAGVPVEVAADELPLVREPAVAPLLDALRTVVHLDVTDPEAESFVDAGQVQALLTSPLGGLDATEVRALARHVRLEERARTAADGGAPRPSADVLREAVLEPGRLDDADAAGVAGVAKARALGDLLRAARAVVDGGGTAEEALWALWSGTSWPERLRRGTTLGGAAARRAHRDLDAVCALFEGAAKMEEQRGHTGVGSFLDTLVAQEIPSDTLAERGVRGDAVRLLTAHRSKGLEWRLVVVAHVQEETWPDLRRRVTLLGADRIGGPGDDLLPPPGVREALMEERRLFYVACTRARERLVVTAVRSPEDDGEQPSRFLAETGVDPVHRVGRPTRPLSMTGVVAHLRRTVADPERPEEVRRAAARRLAALASARDVEGRPLVRAADPGTWWGTRGLTFAETPVRPADQPLRISASTLSSILVCPLRWFLEREAGGSQVSSASQGFGLVLHALAERVATGELPGDPAAVDDLIAHVDEVWPQMSFRTPWSGARERAEARAALLRFLRWHTRPEARRVLGVEQHLRAELRLDDGERIVLNGFADRLEIDDQHRVVVVDLKTGKYPPTGAEVAEHPQLGLYQLAVELGAADELLPPEHRPARSGGAELVQLRKETRGSVKVQAQPPQEADATGRRLVEQQLALAARVVRGESFGARAGGHCDTCAFVATCPATGAGTVLS